jgi:hypothetical protein
MATYLRFGPVVALLAIMLAVLLPFASQPRPAEAAVAAGFTVTLSDQNTDTNSSYTFAVDPTADFVTGSTLTVTFPSGTFVPDGALTVTGSTLAGVAVTGITGAASARSAVLTAGTIATVAGAGTGTIAVVIGTAAGIKNPANSSDALKLKVKTNVTGDTTDADSAAYRVGVLIVASPTAAGDLAEYIFTFNVSANVPANTGEIKITWDKDTQIPSSISRANVLISATSLLATDSTTGTTGANQVVSVLFDPTFDTDTADPNRKVLTLKVPDMNPATTSGQVFAEGAQGIASGATVTVTFSTGVGIKNETERTTSAFDFKVSATAGGANVISPASKGGVAITSKIVLSSVDGARGTTVTVTGQGFNDKTAVTVWLDNPGGTANNTLDSGEVKLAENVIVGADDRFTATFTVNAPPFVPGKKNTIAVVDGEGRKADGTLPAFELRGQITVTPTSAALGATITVQLKDFDISSDLKTTTPLAGYASVPSITVGGVAVTIPASTLTDSNGEKTFSTTIPNGVALGVQTVRVLNLCCLKGGGESSTRSTNITITGAVITLTPGSAVPNQSITVIGRGYTDGKSTVKVNVAGDASSVTIGGSSSGLKDPASTSIASTFINYGKDTNTVSVDNGGNWSFSLVVPITSTTTTAGTHQLKVIDAETTTAGREGVVNLVIPARTLKLDQASSRGGTTLRITGTGFPADNSNSPATTPSVTITYDGGTNLTASVQATPDTSGNFSAALVVPINANIPSTNTVKAVFSYPSDPTVPTGAKSESTTTVTHDVPGATLSISPGSGPPGTPLTLSGVGFKAYSNVSALEIGGTDIVPSPKPATGNTGDFSATALVPQLNTGAHTVTAKVGTTTASVAFTVTVAPVAPPAPPPAISVAPAAALAPLGANLVRTWGYNAATQKFQLYDPAAAPLSDLTALNRGGGYWINVKAAQTVTLGSGSYSLSAGWNLIGWLG